MKKTTIRVYPRQCPTRKAQRPEYIAYCGADTWMTVQEMSAYRTGILVYPATGGTVTGFRCAREVIPYLPNDVVAVAPTAPESVMTNPRHVPTRTMPCRQNHSSAIE